MGIEDGFVKRDGKSAPKTERGEHKGAAPARRRRREALSSEKPPRRPKDTETEDAFWDSGLPGDFGEEPAEGSFPKGAPGKGQPEDEDDLDLFDDIAIGDENEQDDPEIAEDAGMEQKLFDQGLHTTGEKRKTQGLQPQDGRRTDPYGGGRRAEERRGGRKGPRELNTAGSTVDQKKLRREQEQKKRSGLKKIIGWAAVELLTLCLIFGYGYLLRTLHLSDQPKVNKAAVENNNLSVEKKKEMEGYWNFYIFGVDDRDGRVARGNSDVIMIASINQDTGDIRLVSVFRDTYLNVSDRNSYNKINQAYAQGGPEQAIAALNKNLDLNITNYVTVNWAAVAHGINILGGVDDVDITKAELYYINAFITETVKSTGIGSVQLTHTGPQHLDGVQSVAYGRLRLMDSDFARSERQREIIEKLFAKAKKADFSVLNNILVDCFPMVAIDIPMQDLVRMAQGISKYNIVDTAGFPWQRGDANVPGKGACVIPASLESNVIRLHEFLFGDQDYQPSEAVLRYSQKIKEDSSLYKEGKPIESVGTGGGYIPKQKTSAADEEADEETSEKKSSHETEEWEWETDENGEFIYPTDEDGNEIRPTDEDGNEIVPVRPSRHQRPTDLAEETEGDAGSEIVDENGNVIGTSPNPGGTHTATDPSGNHTVNPGGSHATNPTRPSQNGVANPDGTRPTEGGTSTRPTEVISDEPHSGGGTSNNTPGGDTAPQPTQSPTTVISPTKPEPTMDNSGPGAGLTPEVNAPQLTPDAGNSSAGPGM